MLPLLGLLPLAALGAATPLPPIPIAPPQGAECFGYNPAGCPYSDVGKRGAVATVSALGSGNRS